MSTEEFERCYSYTGKASHLRTPGATKSLCKFYAPLGTRNPTEIRRASVLPLCTTCSRLAKALS